MTAPTKIRKDFNDTERAKIFKRDHATCGFSGVSLWLLDYGIRPNWQMDWVDHIKPSSKGGATHLDNGICSSHTFNQKKRGNGADNVYFIKQGQIHANYLTTFGCPPPQLVAQLERLAKLDLSDWYLNRCIANTFVGFDWRCANELYHTKRIRDDEYWFKSGWKRLKARISLRPTESLRNRGLIGDPEPFGTNLLLQLEDVTSEPDYRLWTHEIFGLYRTNYRVFFQFLDSKEGSKKREKIRIQSSGNLDINPEILRIINLPAKVLHEAQ